MTSRSLLIVLLALGLMSALPLAVDGFLRGGHTTPEQGLRHHAAVMRTGMHDHADDHAHDHRLSAPSETVTASLVVDGEPGLRADTVAVFGAAWLGLLTLSGVGLSIGAVRVRMPRDAVCWRAVAHAVPTPPPRGVLRVAAA